MSYAVLSECSREAGSGFDDLMLRDPTECESPGLHQAILSSSRDVRRISALDVLSLAFRFDLVLDDIETGSFLVLWSECSDLLDPIDSDSRCFGNSAVPPDASSSIGLPFRARCVCLLFASMSAERLFVWTASRDACFFSASWPDPTRFDPLGRGVGDGWVRVLGSLTFMSTSLRSSSSMPRRESSKEMSRRRRTFGASLSTDAILSFVLMLHVLYFSV